MAEIATGIVLIAGTMTFGNEWYQTGKVNWRIPVATVLAAAVFDGLAHIDSRAAVGLSIIVLMGAATTKFGGHSVVDTVASFFAESTKQPAKSKLKVA
jgi:hypothetical protein